MTGELSAAGGQIGTSAADKAELRELVERYALAVDRADAAGVAALFADDGVMALFMRPPGEEQTAVRSGREEIESALAALTKYDATHHTISAWTATVDGDEARGETRCEAHHVADGADRVLFLHYIDTYRRTESKGWRFIRREVHARWSTTLAADQQGL